MIRAYEDIGMRVSYSFALRDQNRLVYQNDQEFTASLPAELRPALQRALWAEGRGFTRVGRDAALREPHESLQHALGDDEIERRQLSKALLPHVWRFYAGYFDPEGHVPYYRRSSQA
jgi:hypothetical protein